MLPQIPVVEANDTIFVQPATVQQHQQQQVVVVMVPAPQPPVVAMGVHPLALTLNASQMHGVRDAVVWNTDPSFATSMAMTTTVPDVAWVHQPLLPVPLQPGHAHGHLPHPQTTWYETPAVPNTIPLPAIYAEGESATVVQPQCQTAASVSPWCNQGMFASNSQDSQLDQSDAMPTACCFLERKLRAEPESEPIPVDQSTTCKNAAQVDDFISTASESERIYGMLERRYSTETENTQAVSVSLNDLASCSSSTASSSQRRHRRRRGRRGAAGGAAAPPQTANVTTGTVSATRAGEKSVSCIAATRTTDSDAVALSEEDAQKLLDQLGAGSVAARMALTTIGSSVPLFAFDAVGCRIVQRALEVGNAAETESLVSELHGHVRNAMTSPHANFVIQKIVEVLPVGLASFVAEELAGIGAEVARHRYGCRILCRLSEHHSNAACPATKRLFDEILANAAQLCHHSFARHVIESVLEHGSADQRHRVALAINGDLLHNARNRNASYVVEKAFGFCSIESQEVLASTLLRSGVDRIVALALHDCGSHVLKALLESRCSDHVERVKQILKAETAKLELSKYGKSVLQKI